MGTAFLKVLKPEETELTIEEIHKKIFQKFCINEIRPFEEYTPKGYGHRFIVWCNTENERLSDEEAMKFVGQDGDILYFWTCVHCLETVCKYELPSNHAEDYIFKCHCMEG